MKKTKQIIIIMLLLSVISIIFSTKSQAASATISAPSTATVGEPITISVSGTGVQWNLSLSVNGTEIASNSELENYQSNKTISFSGTYTPSSQGTLNVTLTGSVTEFSDGSTTTDFGSKTITVSAPAPEPTPTSDPEPSTPTTPDTPSTPTTPEEPKFDVTFTEASGTVYTTVNSLNFRSTSTGDVIGSIENTGTELEVTGRADGKVRVKYNGTEGYVSSDYVTSEKPEVKEEKSNNANLKSLTIEGVTLSPEFKADVTSYKAEVGKDVKELNVKAEAEDEKAKVDIKGNKDLKDGENKVAISVSAEDGTIKIYEITVTKKDAVVLGLKSLKIKDTNMANQFKTDKYNYEFNINDVDKLEIEAVPTIETAKVEILGNENLQDGENLITIMVKSEDGKQTVTYQIKVNKNVEEATEAATNNNNKLDSRVYLYGGICVLAFIILVALIVYLIRNKVKNSNEVDDEENLYDFDEENKKDHFKNEFSNDFNDEVEQDEIEEKTDNTKRGKGKHF